MRRLATWLARSAEALSAALLAALFVSFLVQIFARLVMQAPFGWTLELSLILWVWLVFFTAAFVMRDRDQIRFDILTRAGPRRVQRRLALVSASVIAVTMTLAFWPTWAYIDWLAIRKTATVRDPFTGAHIPMRTVFSVYALFMLALAVRYGWRTLRLLRRGPPEGPAGDDPA